jgi:hypothetical protein
LSAVIPERRASSSFIDEEKRERGAQDEAQHKMGQGATLGAENKRGARAEPESDSGYDSPSWRAEEKAGFHDLYYDSMVLISIVQVGIRRFFALWSCPESEIRGKTPLNYPPPDGLKLRSSSRR